MRRHENLIIKDRHINWASTRPESHSIRRTVAQGVVGQLCTVHFAGDSVGRSAVMQPHLERSASVNNSPRRRQEAYHPRQSLLLDHGCWLHWLQLVYLSEKLCVRNRWTISVEPPDRTLDDGVQTRLFFKILLPSGNNQIVTVEQILPSMEHRECKC